MERRSIELDKAAVTQALLEMASEALLALSAEGDVLSCNQAAGAVFGFADVVGKRFPALFNGASDLASSALDQARRDGAASFRWTRSEDAPLSNGVSVTMRRVSGTNGHPPFIAVRGTSEPKPSLSAATDEGSDPRMRGLLEGAPDAMLLVESARPHRAGQPPDGEALRLRSGRAGGAGLYRKAHRRQHVALRHRRVLGPRGRRGWLRAAAERAGRSGA